MPLFTRQNPHVFTNYAEHHFVRTTTDGRKPTIAIGARNGIVPGVAHAAPILQAGVGYFAQQAPCFQFRHGREFRDIFAANVQINRAISQRTQGFDFGLKFRQTKMNDLKIQHAAHSRSSWKCCI